MESNFGVADGTFLMDKLFMQSSPQPKNPVFRGAKYTQDAWMQTEGLPTVPPFHPKPENLPSGTTKQCQEHNKRNLQVHGCKNLEQKASARSTRGSTCKSSVIRAKAFVGVCVAPQ